MEFPQKLYRGQTHCYSPPLPLLSKFNRSHDVVRTANLVASTDFSLVAGTWIFEG